MTERFDKDAWILRAIAKRAILAKEDGTVWRNAGLKPHPQSPDHKVTHWKRVKFSTHKKSGRVYFTLTFEGITKSVLVNRVIGLALIPNPDNLPEVNHIDGVKAHNWKSNLEWDSRSSNEKHAFSTGLKATRGSQNSNVKLTASQVLEIRASEAKLSELAKQFGVSPSTIRAVRERKTWSHL